MRLNPGGEGQRPEDITVGAIMDEFQVPARCIPCLSLQARAGVLGAARLLYQVEQIDAAAGLPSTVTPEDIQMEVTAADDLAHFPINCLGAFTNARGQSGQCASPEFEPGPGWIPPTS